LSTANLNNPPCLGTLMLFQKRRFCDTLAFMFNIGFPELILILVVALLVVGPSKLPELARSMGKAFGQFRRMADDVRDTLEQEVTVEEKPQEKKDNPTPQGDEGKPNEPKKS
jgi:sec-independent protein translocase protein TatB